LKLRDIFKKGEKDFTRERLLEALKERGYTPTDTEKLWNGLDPRGHRGSI